MTIAFDSYVLCKVILRDDGAIQLSRIGSFASPRQAFNTVLELNIDAADQAELCGDPETFYQIEYRPGVDTTIDF